MTETVAYLLALRMAVYDALECYTAALSLAAPDGYAIELDTQLEAIERRLRRVDD